MASDNDTPGSKPSAEKPGAGTTGTGGATSGATKPTPTSAAGAASKRPVTIDLKPQKSESKSSASGPVDTKPESAASKSSPSAATSRPPQAPSGSAATASAARPSTSASSGKGASAGSDPKPSVASAAKRSSEKSAAPGASKTFSSPPAAADKGGVGVAGVVASAVFGGLVVLAGAYGLHVAGVLKLQPEQSAGVGVEVKTALNRISGLEKTVGDLASEASAGAAASKRLDSLQKRVEALASAAPDTSVIAVQAEIATLKSSYETLSAQMKAASGEPSGDLGALTSSMSDMTKRIANVEATAKAAQTAVSSSDVSLKTLADSQARASETLATLSADIRTNGEKQTTDLGKIQSELNSLSKRLAAVEATMGDATAREVAARALSVSALKSAVDSGRPYETELVALKAGLPKDTNLAALEAHAKTGVAPVSVLIAEFPKVARAMFAKFSEPARSGDMLDSLLAGAKSIVAVRGPGDEAGTGPEAILRRMEIAVGKGDLSAALTAYELLPSEAKSVGADWAGRAKARVAIDQLTDAASSEVLAALSRKDS
ncbi:COG4223 family protein [Roseibium algae]|uniref:Mitofilin family membrane protein n=1 Tax=Roseibium algae TaxID=3123038 RepID=A0ABU8TNN6_9HYPH